MTQPISSTDRRRIQDDDTSSAPSPAPTRPAVRDIDVDALAHGAFDYGVLTQSATPVAIPPSPTQVAQTKLDTYRSAFAGPYLVEGKSVSAAPQFRMAGGFNDAAAGYSRNHNGGKIDLTMPQVRELYALCAAAGVAPQHALVGAPSARELVAVTQVLIDAGKLPSGPEDVQTRIKDMQWTWGIGIDCTDYVLSAAMKVAGKSRSEVTFTVNGTVVPSPGTDYFQQPEHNPHLASVAAASAKPGDVFRLDAKAGEVGHRAVVYSNTECDATKCRELAVKYGANAASFLQGGPVRAIEVDASWGAGEFGAAWGGVRRDTWFYNESSHAWAQLNQRVSSAAPSFEVTPQGPAGESLHGVYRFR